MKIEDIKRESREIADQIDNLRAVESEDAAVIEQRDADLGELMARAEELEAAAEKAAKVAEARQKLEAARTSAKDGGLSQEAIEQMEAALNLL